MTDKNQNTMVDDTVELTEEEMKSMMMISTFYGGLLSKLDDDEPSETAPSETAKTDNK